jgi:hypothetical protein
MSSPFPTTWIIDWPHPDACAKDQRDRVIPLVISTPMPRGKKQNSPKKNNQIGKAEPLKKSTNRKKHDHS